MRDVLLGAALANDTTVELECNVLCSAARLLARATLFHHLFNKAALLLVEDLLQEMQVVQGDLVILPDTTNYAAQLKRSDIIETYAAQKNLHRVAFKDHSLNAVAHEKDCHNFLLPLISEEWKQW